MASRNQHLISDYIDSAIANLNIAKTAMYKTSSGKIKDAVINALSDLVNVKRTFHATSSNSIATQPLLAIGDGRNEQVHSDELSDQHIGPELLRQFADLKKNVIDIIEIHRQELDEKDFLFRQFNDFREHQDQTLELHREAILAINQLHEAQEANSATAIEDMIANKLQENNDHQAAAIKVISDKIIGDQIADTRTFADVAASDAQGGGLQQVTKKKVHTRKTRHLLFVKPKEQNGSALATKAEFKQTLSDNASDLAIIGIKLSGNQSILIETNDSKKKKTIIDAFNSKPELVAKYTIEESRKHLPTIALLNVSQEDIGMANEVANKLIFANPSLQNIANFKEGDIRFVYARKATSGRGHLRDLIFRVSPQVRRSLLSLHKVHFGFGFSSCEDFTLVTQCYRCRGFGHQARDCHLAQDQVICSHCEGNHNPKDCPVIGDKSKASCVSCREFNERRSKHGHPDPLQRDIKHSATSRHCPEFKGMVALIESRTDYGD